MSGKAIGYKERGGSTITLNGDRHSQGIVCLQQCLSLNKMFTIDSF